MNQDSNTPLQQLYSSALNVLVLDLVVRNVFSEVVKVVTIVKGS